MEKIFQTYIKLDSNIYEILENYNNKECKISNEFNCFYDVYFDETFISKINKNRLSNFLNYIENSPKDTYNYSLKIYKNSIHKFDLLIDIFSNIDKIYKN